MGAGGPSIDAVLVLDQDDLDIVDVEEVSCATIGIELFLVDLESYPRRIVITFKSIIDCANDALALREFRCNGFTNIRGEGCYTALTRKMVSEKCYLLDGGNYLHGLACDQLSRFSLNGVDSLCVRSGRHDRTDRGVRRARARRRQQRTSH